MYILVADSSGAFAGYEGIDTETNNQLLFTTFTERKENN